MPEGGDVATLTLRDHALAGLARLVPASHAARAELVWLVDRALPPLSALRAEPAPDDRTLVALAVALELSDDELIACALAREVELDALLAHTLAQLQGDGAATGPQRPTFGLLVRGWLSVGASDAGRARLGAVLRGPALASGLLQPARDDVPLSARSFALHPALLPVLGRGDAPATASFGTQHVARVDLPPWPCPAAWRNEVARLAEAMRDEQRSARTVIVVRARTSAEACGVAAHIGARLGRPLIRISGAVRLRRANGEGGGDDASLAPGIEPWLVATDSVPMLSVDTAPGEVVELPRFAHYPGPLVVACGADGDIESPADASIIHWRVEIPLPEDRASLWREALSGVTLDEGVDLDTVAKRGRCSVSALWAIAASARGRATLRDGPLTDTDIASAACIDVATSTHGLSALAQWVPCAGIEHALVATDALAAELELILTRCTARETVAAGRGPALAARYSPGVKVLFLGPSGTGKTLAAQWLAARLRKPLYRVDLAAVSSKYIGETEKNLAQLLARAEHLDCLLLFDEADSLFGSRT